MAAALTRSDASSGVIDSKMFDNAIGRVIALSESATSGSAPSSETKGREAARPEQPTVSVVIPAHNSWPYLKEQLDAVAAQTYSGQIEVVVADNNSTSPLREHCPVLKLSGVRFVDAVGGSGAAYARNAGAEVATGEFLAFCDADDVVHPTWLDTLVRLAASHDLVGTAIETGSVNTHKALDRTPTSTPEQQGKSAFLPFAIGASLGCWASVYRELGGMNTDVKASEDVEFSWRAQINGFTLGFERTALVGYRLREDLRPLLRQSYILGYGFAQVQGQYRDRGCPPVKIGRVLYWWMMLTLGNPLVPRRITKISRGQWLRAVAAHVGELRGGIRYRTFAW
ncbi:MAG: glycosyltransferase [Rhodococcus sp. (in: high G+C Gram-positive bacteria)]|nr:glycosyltransferase family 2 protein [Rhodococcus sp. (in: high G+C Gram-positive bacteria)]MDI6627522.1 glycosyltransferase [Rhodococcus sp. (in: high G+C Gram-positive bacteria)]